MKKSIYLLLSLFLFVGCDSALDIVPKGQTTLDDIDELELMLNQDYRFDVPTYDISILCNECYTPPYYNISLIISQVNTLAKAYLTYDEVMDRVNLTYSDDRYSTAYSYINYMNVIIDRVPKVPGDDNRKKQILAEAHLMRAYMHWLLVNLHAAQYQDEESAKTTGGIPYVTDLDVKKTKEKLTLAEVYRLILEDCSDEYINALPDEHSNIFRGDKAWGNAVRAKVLMQMKRYSDTLPYALASLQYNNRIEDRSVIMSSLDWNLPRDSKTNLLYIGRTPSPYRETVSIETANLFEVGDYVKDYAHESGSPTAEMAWSTLYGESYGGVKGALCYVGASTYTNNWGITSDRMYYTAAECYIRTGKYKEGLDLVNEVRKYRIDAEHYTEFSADTEKDAMELLQKAKWIECIGSYENFFDCKRWNSEEAYRRTIVRNIPNIGTFELKPDSPLWIFPFATNDVSFNPTLTQNY